MENERKSLAMEILEDYKKTNKVLLLANILLLIVLFLVIVIKWT